MGREDKKMEIDLSLKIDSQEEEEEAPRKVQDDDERADVKLDSQHKEDVVEEEEDTAMAASGEVLEDSESMQLSLQDNMKTEEVLFILQNLVLIFFASEFVQPRHIYARVCI